MNVTMMRKELKNLNAGLEMKISEKFDGGNQYNITLNGKVVTSLFVFKSTKLICEEGNRKAFGTAKTICILELRKQEEVKVEEVKVKVEVKMELAVEEVSKRTKAGYSLKEAIDGAIYGVFTTDEIKYCYNIYFETLMMMKRTWETC